jgi:phenylalanyl-tRNA synthetase alpha chain
MTNPYQKSMETKVVEIIKDSEDTFRVLLDKTVFYPMGGGQPTDQGFFELATGEKIEVFQVMVKDGEIWHYIHNNSLSEGDLVKGEINWERRYKNMKVHSAGHVIDFGMYLLGYTPSKLSPQKGDHGKKPYIVYAGTTDRDIKMDVENKANELIEKGVNFSWEFKPLEVLEKEAIYLQPNLPVNKPLRVLTLEGVGSVADGGTIVENTSEVGKIVITNVSTEDGNTIIEYKVEESLSTTSQAVSKESKTRKLENSKALENINITNIRDQFTNELEGNNAEEALTNLWRKYLGKDGLVTELLKDIKNIPATERKQFGQDVNNLKNEIDALINNKKKELKEGSNSEYLKVPQASLDFSRPKIGHIHPLTETINDLNAIFRSLGYSVMDGDEIQTDEYNFQRLNVPLDHPARDLQDTIYVEEPNILLRTQTSAIESHILEKLKPPYKIVVPGRVYRNEKVNRSNHFMFHHYQLVCVKEKVSLSELLATIDYLFKSYLGEDVVTRYRNKYYPEVEPGVGPDMQCFNCHGEGCPLCKGRGWLEMGGAGIIHPNVMRMAGLDTNKWQGYAFGLGLDRWAMAKHNIKDIRTLLSGTLGYKPSIG